MRQKVRYYLGGLGVILALALLPSLALAGQFIRTDVPTLRDMSDSVVHARAANIESAWDEEGRMIFTYVTLSVLETLHGFDEDEIVVRVPGGTVDGYTVMMDGAPQFRQGEIVVAFINQWNDGTPKVAGYFQGLSRVVLDQLGNSLLRGGAADGRSIAQLARDLRQAGGDQ